MRNQDEHIYVCPHCLHGIKKEGDTFLCVNPECGYELDFGDWPDGRAYLAEGLIAPEAPGEPYRVAPPAVRETAGRCLDHLPLPLAGEITIGSDTDGAELRISGAEPLHAMIFRNCLGERFWWVLNLTEAGTFVNNAPVKIRRLVPGDVIDIAGVRMMFRGDALESVSGGEALRFSLRKVSVARNGNRILNDVSLTFAGGEFIGVVGASGCGKSSLLQCLAGLVNFEKGSLVVNGHNASTDDSIRRSFQKLTSYLPQNVDEALHDGLTVREELAIFHRLHLQAGGNDGAVDDANLRTLLLDGKKDSRISTLSGGEKKRVAVALALAKKSRVLLLDEPAAGLDPLAAAELMHHLREVTRQGSPDTRPAVICSTHVLDDAGLFDKILVMAKEILPDGTARGNVCFFGTPDEVCAHFGVSSVRDIYRKLADAHETWGDNVEDNTLSALPTPPAKASWWQCVCGYWVRTCRETFGSGRRNGRWWKLPEWFSRFVAQPLGLVLALRIACAENFSGVDGVETLWFCAALSMFWLGLVSSVRLLVQERIPGRCLERLNGVPLGAYLGSKALWCVATGFVTGIAYFAFLWAAAGFRTQLSGGGWTGIDIPCAFVLPLVCACWAGMFVGLAVSAISRNETAAVSRVPLLAVCALLFSDIVLGADASGFAVWVSKVLMPCYWAEQVMGAAFDNRFAAQGFGVLFGGDFSRMILQLLGYMVIGFAVMFIFQRRNEKAWEGR